MQQKMIFTYLKQPLNKYTFKAPKVLKWLQEYTKNKIVLNLFSGPTFIGNCTEIRNDIDNNMPALYHQDALDLVKELVSYHDCYDRIVLDPPYSYRKSMELYNGHRNSRFKRLLDELPKILTEDGKVITFGYHSSVMSNKRGFKIVEILLISHGGAQHDTIATVEERI